MDSTLGAWCFGGKRVYLVGPAIYYQHRDYLNLARKLKFDESDCILGNDKTGEFLCILRIAKKMRKLFEHCLNIV